MIDTVHDYYTLPFLIPFYMVLSYAIYKLAKFNNYFYIPILLLLIPISQRSYNYMQPWWTNEKLNFDPLIIENLSVIKKLTDYNDKCIIINDNSSYTLSYLYDKECYIFANDYLPESWITDMIKNNGVKYMYSNSRIVDEREDVKKYLEQEIYSVSSLKVFKLKTDIQ